MQSLSGNYPEVWVVYDIIYTKTGETQRHYILIPHTRSIIVALRYFKQRSPELPDGSIGKLIQIRYWKSPLHVEHIKPESYIWRTHLQV